MIIDKLIDSIVKLKNPTVVGLDPRLDTMPKYLVESVFSNVGETPEGAGEIITQWATEIIDNIYDIVPAVKPQIAMYEMYGAPGIAAYKNVISYAKKKGLIVIGDAKRNDISSSATCYADGHIGRVLIGSKEYCIFDEDFLTVNPYLGYDSIEPFLDCCKKYDKGLFVLVKTSNPGSNQFQNMKMSDGQELYIHVGNAVGEWGKDFVGKYGYSAIGAVVGATQPSEAITLREKLPATFFLTPGYGAQGAKAEDIKSIMSGEGIGVIVNSSRGITEAYTRDCYKSEFSQNEFAKAARQAAIDMKNDIYSI